jgi:ketosteroid isomerase-like protein
MKADEKTRTAVLAAMNQWLESYKKRDIKGLMDLIAPDEDIFMFGTGVDEVRIGPEQFRYQAQRDWEQTEALAFELNQPLVSSAGPVAWLATEGVGKGVAGGQEITFPLRMTGVFERRDGRWLLTQAHVSLPSAVQDEGDSVPV